MKPVVVLFDVNETLLDMAPLKENINTLLSYEQGFNIWFGMLLQYSLVDTCIDNYHDFTFIADATLSMAAKALLAVIVLKFSTEYEADQEYKKRIIYN